MWLLNFASLWSLCVMVVCSRSDGGLWFLLRLVRATCHWPMSLSQYVLTLFDGMVISFTALVLDSK